MVKNISISVLAENDTFRNYFKALQGIAIDGYTFKCKSNNNIYVKNFVFPDTDVILLLDTYSIKSIDKCVIKAHPCILKDAEGNIYNSQEWLNLFR